MIDFDPMKRAKYLQLPGALLCGCGAARADDYPAKSVHLTGPLAAGGAVGGWGFCVGRPA